MYGSVHGVVYGDVVVAAHYCDREAVIQLVPSAELHCLPKIIAHVVQTFHSDHRSIQ